MRPILSFAALAVLFPSVLAFSGKTCRTMPLGASITFGTGSSSGNGYRDDLYNLLARDGNVVNMVGNHLAKDSTFHDKDTEGWPGKTIKEVTEKMRISMPHNRPNIVTILVGTNDMSQDGKEVDAEKRLGNLIQEVLDWPPLTLVVVSTIPPHRNSTVNERTKIYNGLIPKEVEKLNDKGKSVVFVDCGKTVTVKDLPDGIHPNDAGYERIGKCFYDGIVAGEKKGWLYDVQGPAP